MEEKLGDRLLGIIHRDESVVEANASQKSILDFNSSSAAAFDIEIIAKKISAQLGINIGDGRCIASLAGQGFNLIAGLLNEKTLFWLLVLVLSPIAVLVVITPMDSQKQYILAC